jgi:hypothetical protein
LEAREPLDSTFSICVGRENSSEDLSGEGDGDNSGTSLAISALVSATSRPPHRLSHSDSPSSTHHHHSEQGSTNRPHELASESRLSYLRRRLAGEGFSEKVQQYYVASVRESTNKQYDSAFQRYVRWCEERNLNPMEPNANQIGGYLIDLFEGMVTRFSYNLDIYFVPSGLV